MNLQTQPTIPFVMAVATTLSPMPQNANIDDAARSDNTGKGITHHSSCREKLQRYQQEITVRDFPCHLDIGNASLYLINIPKFVCKSFKTVWIEGWNIQIPIGDFCSEHATRDMARQFLRLHRTLHRDGELSEVDQGIWTFIGTQVDYARYCEDSAVPVYCQGVLISRKNGQAVVEWQDQTQSVLSGEFAGCLNLVDAGESFGCEAKFVDRKLVVLRNVEPLFLHGEVDTSWIKPFQPMA